MTRFDISGAIGSKNPGRAALALDLLFNDAAGTSAPALRPACMPGRLRSP